MRKLILLLLVIGLCACQSDDDQPEPQKSVKVIIDSQTSASQRELVGCAGVSTSTMQTKDFEETITTKTLPPLALTKTTKDCTIAEKDKGKISFSGNNIKINYKGLFIPRMELTITKDSRIGIDITKTNIIFL